MNRTYFVFLFFIVSRCISHPEQLTHDRAEQFIKCMLSGSDSLTMFVLPEELSLSQRLGITYTDAHQKFFIGSVLDDTVKTKILQDSTPYTLTIDSLGNGYSRLNFSVPSHGYTKTYFFSNGFTISNARFYSDGWQRRTSKHFVFMISDSSYFNEYSVSKLESFVDSISSLLQFSDEQKKTLEQEKIYYYLCKDQDEIEKVTGFNTLGMALLAQDYVATTYNCHFHELLHLLINFKLHSLPLYTNPFFQEGFAVALGGRGGKESLPILSSGVFLIKSGMLSVNDILSKQGFQRQDPSMTYPVSGLYNKFLLKELGVNNYLKLYLKYSGSAENVLSRTIDTTDLPPESLWMNYVDGFRNNISLAESTNTYNRNPLLSNNKISAYDEGDNYFLRVKDTVLLSENNPTVKSSSKVFEDNFHHASSGEKYLIVANTQEIKLYNLYTNNLIASYVASFSLPPKEVSQKNGYYEFTINKQVLDEDISTLTVK